MTLIELIRFISLIVIILLSFTLFIIALVGASKKGFTRQRLALLVLSLGAIFIIYLAYNVREISPANWAQIMLMLGLVAVTGAYAFSASKQADASVEMAKEMREQRVMASRPVIIQKAVYETETRFRTFGSRDWFSHFEVYNAGNSPAIEVEVSLLNKKKSLIHSQRKTFLRAGDPPIEFSPSELASLEKSTYYLVSEYQSIFSRGPQQTWYQTWLPFETTEASEKGKIYVISGELETKEVTDKDRINAFGGRSKPK